MKFLKPDAIRGRSGRSGTRSLAALAAALALGPVVAFAAVQVTGSPQAVSIETQNNSIDEILAARETIDAELRAFVAERCLQRCDFDFRSLLRRHTLAPPPKRPCGRARIRDLR